MVLVCLDTSKITDWDSYHKAFKEVFGYPDFYGRNMDAWIDCMTYLDDPAASMTRVHAKPGDIVVLQLENMKDFAKRCPEQYAAVVECSAFVNWRRIEKGDSAVLALSFYS